ncbi:MAG: hypothetical protein E7541_02940 [Ruminococcaceae bacterium]|nr:hypothetical protein [Oscillospiraceae bacterium]
MKEQAIRELKLLEVRRMAADSLRLRRRVLEADALGLADRDERTAATSQAWLCGRCDRLQQQEALLREQVTQTERVLASMPSRQRTVLEALYVHPRQNPIRWLQDTLYVSRTQVYRIREEALTRFSLLLGLDLVPGEAVQEDKSAV